MLLTLAPSVNWKDQHSEILSKYGEYFDKFQIVGWKHGEFFAKKKEIGQFFFFHDVNNACCSASAGWTMFYYF